MDEIPEALRDESKSKTDKLPKSAQPAPRKKSRGLLLKALIGIGAVLSIALPFLFRLASKPEQEASLPPPPDKPAPEPTFDDNVDNILGHLPYQEAPKSDLKAVTSDGRIKLRTTAAKKYLQMKSAASANGITLIGISGFRSVSEQEALFFTVKEQRGQGVSKRAEVSAPPGYSEHHTGYAIDIGDGNVPSTNLSPNFEKTPAFRWLEQNAPRYSFEISFPKNNLQGIAYEPWHWRFVGDRDSIETFYKVRNLQPKTNRK